MFVTFNAIEHGWMVSMRFFVTCASVSDSVVNIMIVQLTQQYGGVHIS